MFPRFFAWCIPTSIFIQLNDFCTCIIILYYSYGIYHAHAVTRLRSKYRQPYLESGLESDAESDIESGLEIGLESDVESDVESGLESDVQSLEWSYLVYHSGLGVTHECTIILL